MKLESFNDVLNSLEKNKDRDYHLLLGNGFSMAYDNTIFSYNALHEFITKIKDAELSKILSLIEHQNFELIMQQLGTFSSLIGAFEGQSALKDKVDSSILKLKESLLDAIHDLHPEHVFKIPENESASCAEFLNIFLKRGGKIFSTNYDLLLYWVLMRNDALAHNDGFGRDATNFVPGIDKEDIEWSDLYWGRNKEGQNVYYVHGALPLFDIGTEILKEEYELGHNLLEKISSRMEDNEYPIFVTAGNGDEKLAHIMHNQYLANCYESLSEITGTLVIFGFNFGSYDYHIIEAINRAAKKGKKEFPKLLSIYIGVYSDDDLKHIEQIEVKFNTKVKVFDAKTVNIWRET